MKATARHPHETSSLTLAIIVAMIGMAAGLGGMALGMRLYVMLQIVTVALGSPLGREGAPRDLGAVLATWLANRVALTPEVRCILIACGAGAGLAAVYNVPLG